LSSILDKIYFLISLLAKQAEKWLFGGAVARRRLASCPFYAYNSDHIPAKDTLMNTIVKSGLLIGILCCAWTYVMGFAGWYKDPLMMSTFYLVFVIQIALLIRGLKQTAAEGRAYGAQVAAGTLMSVVAGVIVIGSSLLFTTVVFPQYFEEMRVVQAEMMKAAGKTDVEIAAQLEMAAQSQTPMMAAVFGFIGTVFIGLVSSLVIGAFIRKK